MSCNHNGRHPALLLAVVATLCMALSPAPVRAQWRDVYDRLFTTVRVGANSYLNDAQRPFRHLGYHGEVGVGMNLAGGVGGKIDFLYLNTTNTKEIQSNYLSLQFGLTFDLPTMMFGFDAEREWMLQFEAGLGYVHRQKNYLEEPDNEATVEVGFCYTRPLGNKIYLMGEAKSYLFLPRFDFNTRSSFIFLASAGIQYRFCDNPYRNGLASGGNKIHENWWIMATGGVNFLNYNGIQAKDRLRLMRPSAEIFLGKYLSPVVGLRMGLQGLKAATDAHPGFMISNVHADLMLNISNMGTPRQDRPVSYYLYAGAGLINRRDSQVMTFQGYAGFLTRFWISRVSDIVAEARYMVTTPGFAHDQPGQYGLSVGMLTVSLGYVLNLTSGTMR